MHQLQEQLQINLLQQTHLMQSGGGTNSGSGGNPGNNAGGGEKPANTKAAMQQLQIQQQQLISQLQLVQQRILMVSFAFLKWHTTWRQKVNIDISPPLRCQAFSSNEKMILWSSKDLVGRKTETLTLQLLPVQKCPKQV